jgi:D-glycero-alpha-D-manno-heptose-7-phosphate kinase
MIFRSRAPVRIDFAGGWTDVAQFAVGRPGAVTNAAITIYSYASLVPHASNERASSARDASVKIYSSDYDTYVEAEEIGKLEYDGNIDLVKAAIKQMGVPGGFEIATQSRAPAGSGLGTSAAMGVALIGALGKYGGKYMVDYEVAEMASHIERAELGIRGGKQDHYTSALGGVNFLEFEGERVRYSRLSLPQELIFELEKNLVLCYTGKSRLSGDIHASVASNFDNGEPETVAAIDELKTIAYKMRTALIAGDLYEFAVLLTENWRNQKRLHPSVTNDEIERFFEIAQREGAIGGKALGAGGGGCLLFYCKPERQPLAAKALADAGARILSFQFDFQGLRCWVSAPGRAGW